MDFGESIFRTRCAYHRCAIVDDRPNRARGTLATPRPVSRARARVLDHYTAEDERANRYLTFLHYVPIGLNGFFLSFSVSVFGGYTRNVSKVS